eukprot:CAMPEP_0196762204 /NCGR_PEP_ID=MMETSP1095-20130614/1598_1 /TAXON_ID=96789 ORGANISM="Chromulina nebulosa, Strain UTEXLB2642" /NCGR_SAMPLE_ID=MMETSP1095 /ASSEMBLY_ACC=CAM_ASM_000446 /LENGTH=252 /DNA_ID=CAMNT_0042112695 /DNA_START=106 /DNA_END=867 /DNA_ORIENTATION=+
MRRTVIDSYYKSSFNIKSPEYSFGTGARPSLMQLEGGPGPGAYPIKTTLGKLMESHLTSPPQFTLKSRTKFGDPYERAISKTARNEPGPGQYNLYGKFPKGNNSIASSFPKAVPPRDKAAWAPGPGSYAILQSMGKQVLSTKKQSPSPGLSKAERPSLVPVGTTDIGPAEYNPPPAACEHQVDSRKSTSGTVKFGLGYKKGGNITKPDLSEPSPGPGEYKVPGSIATRSKGTPYNNAPAPSLSGREKFGSPW